MNEQEQLLMELTNKLEAQNKELSQTKALLQQREQELREANETILELSESDLELNEARSLKEEAKDIQDSASNTLAAAQRERAAANKTLSDSEEDRQTIANEKAAWEETKRQQEVSVQKKKNNLEKAYSGRVKKATGAGIMRFKAAFIAVTMYSIIISAVLYLKNGGAVDIEKIIDWFRTYIEEENYIVAVLPTVVPLIIMIIGFVMMKKKDIEFLNMRTLYFELILLALCVTLSGLIRTQTADYNFIVVFYYVSVIRIILKAFLGNEKTGSY